MSVFTNPAGSAKGAAEAYVKGLLELLGDRDPVQVLGAQVAAVQQEVAGWRDEALRRPEKPGKWSILQVLQHLADSDLVSGFRMRMILAHDSPEIQGYDQDAWATRLKYNEVDPADALDQLRVLRNNNLKLIHALNDKQWERAGMHSERGPESIRKIVQMMAGHDILHLNQIRRIKQAVS
ncbi:MAG: DinB family protein [bacterium]